MSSSLDQVLNFAKVTVSVGYGPTATSIQLSSGQGAKLPTASTGAYNLVWWNATDFPDPSDDPAVEIVRVTNGGGTDGDTLTVLRAQETTTASAKQNLNKIYKMQLTVTKKMIDDINTLVSNTGTLKVLTVTGTIPGTSFTASGIHTGSSIIINSNTVFVEGVDYTCSGTAITWLYTLPAGFTSPLTLVCVG